MQLKWFFMIVLSFLIFVSSIIGSILFTSFDKNFYETQFHQNHAYEKFGAEADEAADSVIAYLKGDGELSTFFNQKERAHMKDVKRLYDYAYILLIVCAVLMIGVGVLAFWKANSDLYIIWGGGLLLGIMWAVILGGVWYFTLTNFSSFWTGFHETIFTNDLWMLDPLTDNMIHLFPLSFFENIVWLIAKRAGLLLFAIGLAGDLVLYIHWRQNR